VKHAETKTMTFVIVFVVIFLSKSINCCYRSPFRRQNTRLL